jgi:hypothetical protein
VGRGRVLVPHLAEEARHQVLQGDDAGGAAVLVEHHRQRLPGGLHACEHLGDLRALRDDDGRPDQPAQVDARGRPARAAARRHRQQVLGRQHADHVVDRPLVHREAAVAVPERPADRLLGRRGDRERHHLGARDHHFPGRQVAEGEGALHQLALQRGQQAGPGGAAHQQAQLLGRVDRVLLGAELQPQGPQHQVAEQVEQGDERPEEPRHELRGRGGEQHEGLGALQREHLGHLLAEADVQEGDQREGEDRGDAMRGQPRALLGQHAAQRRAQQAGEGLLAEPPEEEAGDGDAELGRGDEAVGIGLRALHEPRRAAPLRGQLIDARAPRGDEGELGGDEEAVGQHQYQDDEDAPEGREVHGRCYAGWGYRLPGADASDGPAGAGGDGVRTGSRGGSVHLPAAPGRAPRAAGRSP